MADRSNPTLAEVRDGLLSDDSYRFSTALATVLRAALEEKLIGFDQAAHVDELGKAERNREALAELVLCFVFRYEWQ